MLEYVHIQNFQPHADRLIEFGPLTTITGRNSAGKSSIFRALRWVFANKPSGNKFIKRGQSHCSVEVGLDSHTITREKGDGKNCYTLNGKHYEAMGSEVPDAIAALFDMGENNYQSQKEGTLYWFALTDGEVAKELNKVVDLSLIDRAMKAVNTKVKDCERELADARRDWDIAKGECERLAWVDQATEDTLAIQALRLVSDEKKESLTKLEQLLGEIERVGERDQSPLPDAELDDIAALFCRRREVATQLAALEKLITSIERAILESESATERWRQETKAMRDEVGKEKVCPTCRRKL